MSRFPYLSHSPRPYFKTAKYLRYIDRISWRSNSSNAFQQKVNYIKPIQIQISTFVYFYLHLSVYLSFSIFQLTFNIHCPFDPSCMIYRTRIFCDNCVTLLLYNYKHFFWWQCKIHICSSHTLFKKCLELLKDCEVIMFIFYLRIKQTIYIIDLIC